jgi:hemoglobin
MRDAHHHMQLTDAHFEAVAEHLVSTLQDLHVPESLIAEVVALVAGTRNDIVTAS